MKRIVYAPWTQESSATSPEIYRSARATAIRQLLSCNVNAPSKAIAARVFSALFNMILFVLDSATYNALKFRKLLETCV